MSKNAFFSVCVFVVLLALSSVVSAQEEVSEADRTFVAKVSQGGRYEVDASLLALRKAASQDVKDLATAEVHDHELVNRELKSICVAQHVTLVAALNAEFQGKLEHLRSVSGTDFDAAYLEEMSAIHDKDEKLFAQEAVDGGAAAYKAFAAKTDPIVKRHLGALHGTDSK